MSKVVQFARRTHSNCAGAAFVCGVWADIMTDFSPDERGHGYNEAMAIKLEYLAKIVRCGVFR